MATAASWQRARTFFSDRIWEPQARELPYGKRILYGAARTTIAAARTYKTSDVPARAAALTYYTVLAIVPFLAFAFSMAKGLGFYDNLVNDNLLPYLRESFAGNPQLLGAFEKILGFVGETQVSSLGALGLAILVYTAVNLLRNVEAGLNQVYGACKSRPFLRQLVDYVAFIVLAPVALSIVVALTATASAASAGAVEYARAHWDGADQVLAIVTSLSFHLLTIAVIFGGLLVTYLVLPSVRTRLASSAIGAVVGALLWYGALMMHVRFQMGVAGYNALYAGFAALPIFLVWVYVSWMTVLLGASIAAAHQNRRITLQKRRADAADHAFREGLAIAAMARLTHAFLATGNANSEPWTRERLAAALDVPDITMNEVLRALAAAHLVVCSSDESTARWVLARDPDAVRVKDVLDAVRHTSMKKGEHLPLENALDQVVQGVIAGIDRAIAASPENLTLRDLAARVNPETSKEAAKIAEEAPPAHA